MDTPATHAISAATIATAIPARRRGRVDEVAAAVAFLASENAGYITGQTIAVERRDELSGKGQGRGLRQARGVVRSTPS